MPKHLPVNNKIENIKVIKLMTREDLICYVFPEEEKKFAVVGNIDSVVLVGAPKLLTSEYDEIEGHYNIQLLDWIPFSDSTVALIPRDKELAFFKPKKEYIDLYINSYNDAEYYISDYFHKKMFFDTYKFDDEDTFQ